MRISQFQKYSQKENTVTNNVLLMLSRLNDIKTEYYKDLIIMLTENENYLPSPNFQQQVGKGEGIIDGRIEIQASKIIIETKRLGKENIDKLVKYGSRFFKECTNFLWHISQDEYQTNEEKNINNKLKELYPEVNIHFSSLTFLKIVENLGNIYDTNKHNEELKLLYEDFDLYCSEEHLIPDYQYKLIFVPTGNTFDWNFENKMYFCPENWHKQDFAYFGLYRDKSIRTLATVENCIVANFDKTQNQLIDCHSTMNREITEKQRERLVKGLSKGGDSRNGLKYYLFYENDFFETNFCKRSKGGIQGYRYKDLQEHFKEEQLKNKNTKEIADLLKDKDWD